MCVPLRAVSVVVISLFVSLSELSAQSIFTYAGGGTTDGLKATSIGLARPNSLAVDRAGNLYVSEYDRNTVQRVNLDTGVITRYAGNGGGSFSGDNGPALRASLKRPRGIAFDDAGNLFIADYENGRIRRVDAASGVITTFAGGGNGDTASRADGIPATSAFLRRPVAIAWRNGEIYVTDAGYDRHKAFKIDSRGIISTVAGTGVPGFSGDDGPAADALLGEPLGIAVDAAGNVYIADSSNGRIRKVDAVTKKISTVAGGGSPADGVGDGVATGAKLDVPTTLVFDKTGGLVIAETNHGRIRRFDPVSGTIATIAGNGEYHSGDGGPATEAGLYLPTGVAVDGKGNVFFVDSANSSVRMIDAQTKIVSTVAGGGTYIGDGKVASSAILTAPRGMTFDGGGNLLIADSNHALIRRVDKASGIISTFAGTLGFVYAEPQDGKDRRDAVIGYVFDLDTDKDGNIYAGDILNGVIWRIGTDDKISRYAGGNQPDGAPDGDGGLATSASIDPKGIGFDAAGNLYIADEARHRIRRIDAATKIISTVAGSGTAGFSGDGGPALQAMLDMPKDVAFDRRGNMFISDGGNGAIRRIDAASGNITTVAGRGTPASGNGDGGPATNAVITPKLMAIDRNTDDLYVADENGYRLRRIDAKTQIITSVAGSGANYVDTDFSGDNGPATAAKMNFEFDTSGVAIDAGGNLYISDTTNNRVRVLNACAAVSAPQLIEPSNGATNTSTAPQLRWSRVDHALRYDLYLDTVNPPVRVVAADVSDTSFAPANLQPATRYYWSVVSKGDPFCPSISQNASAVASFTTSGTCGAGSFDIISPAEGATVSTSPGQLSWQASSGASTYDVFAGTVNPPPLVAQRITTTQFSATVANGRYYWFVVAHASCDSTKTTSTAVHTFDSNAAVNCPTATQVSLLQPAAGATGVATTVDLTWSANNLVTSYDLYFGATNAPPLLSSNLAATHQIVTGLTPGLTYYWRVVAQTPCSQVPVTSATASFTTRACATPGTPSIVFAPAAVSSGSTYSIVWSVPAGVDNDGGYLVERSLSSTFTSIYDAQVVTTAAATFAAGAPGTLYHRVRALPSCDPSKSGTPSDVKSINIISARPNVIFTTQPAAIVTALGDRLEERRGSFTLENISNDSLQVIIGRQELNGSAPFFTIFDPRGEDAAFVTLEPHRPRTFELRYSGPPNNVAGAFQGVIFVASTGSGLTVTPYAFVNLRIGAGGSGAVPQFVINGGPTDYAAFAGVTGDDNGRTPLQVGIRNAGTTPMELAAEIGPEVWLVPEASWNQAPIAPGATRIVNFTTRRSRAPNGSALPRYTYFTARTRDGQSARLLVQDSEASVSSVARTTRLDFDTRSFIVPEVISHSQSGNVVVSRVRLSNVGSDAVQVELIYTPLAADGFSNSVRRTTIVVPPNDVVTLTDPLVQLFAASRPADGQLEIRVPRERLGLIGVTASTTALSGSGGATIPVVNRGEGAKAGSPHTVYGITADTRTATTLILTETSGAETTTVRASVVDTNGQLLGTRSGIVVPRYGHLRITDLFGVTTIAGGHVDLSVESGGGSVIAMAIVGAPATDSGAVFVSHLSDDTGATPPLMAFFQRRIDATSSQLTTVIPVLSAPTSAGAIPSYQTVASFIAPPSVAGTFTATFRRSGGLTSPLVTFNVGPGLTRHITDVNAGLFGLPANTQGSVFVQSTSGSKVSASLNLSTSAGGPSQPASLLPLPSTASEALTSASASAKRPLFYDGLDQSIDSTRGSRWMLVLNEIYGASGSVSVRLYEAGNRTTPVAEKEVSLAPYQQLQLDTVFSTLGLDAEDRRKDRTNVQCVVTASTGSAQVAAFLVSIDNKTGDTRVFPMAPVAGSATPSVRLVTPVSTQPAQPPKRRAVHH